MEQSNNKGQIDRLCSLLDGDGNVALVGLKNTQLAKKKKVIEFDKNIARYRSQLFTSVGKKLYKVAEPCKFQNMLITDVVDKKYPGPLLYNLVSGTLDIQINSANEQVVFAGITVENVEMEKLQKNGIESFEHCKEVCKEISKLWTGLASLECFDLLSQHNLIQFSINLSGIITV